MARNGTSNRTGLPNGMVPFHQIADPQTRDAVMKLNENVAWLAKRLAALEKGVGNDNRQAAS